MLMVGEFGEAYLYALREPTVGEQKARDCQEKSISPLMLTCLMFAWVGWFGAVATSVWDDASTAPLAYVPARQPDASTQMRLDSGSMVQLAHR
jgi:hypothetical protein